LLIFKKRASDRNSWTRGRLRSFIFRTATTLVA